MPELTVLIDDDDLVHLTWKIAFEAKGKKVRAFHTLKAFEAAQAEIAVETPIYIDVSLGGGVRGEDVARTLFQAGFKNLHLATGHDKNTLEKPACVLSIIGKEPPV